MGVNETVARNVSLKVGDVTEAMEVSAQSELLQTSTSELGNVVEERVIRGVPLQGRNFTQLLLLAPGVNPVSTAQGPAQNGQDSTQINSFEGNSGIPGGFLANASIQGQQNRSKVYYVDGIINTSVRSGSYVALPDVDALQEFKVQSQSDKAEFGGVTGGVVNMTSKSGSNRIRGSVFGYFRDDSLTARDSYRDVVGGVAKAAPEYRQSQFGVNVGGPIFKDKTFFFASYDGWRYKEFADLRYIVPANDNWLNGNFSGFRQLYNPYTTRVVNGRTIRDPFPGNQIPANLISPTMQSFLRTYMVRPNLSGSGVVNNFNFIDFREQTNDSNSFQVRVDHHFSTSDNVFFRWTERRINGYLPLGDVGFRTPDSINRNYGGGWFHTFSPSMVLEVRGGVATQPTEDAPLEHPAGLGPQQGLALPSINQLQGYIINAPVANIAPWTLPGQMGVQGPRPRGNPNWNAAADLTWLRGNHNLKAGFQVLQISRLQKNQFGQLDFSNEPTRDPNATSTTGDFLASALLGLPSQIRGFVPDLGFIDFRTSTYSAYVQDQWTIKPNLTLTYGLRYDYVTRAFGENGTFQSGPDLSTGEWLISLDQMPGVCNAQTPPPCLPSPLSQIPFNQFIRATGDTNNVLKPITDNWGPRVGLAWQINPKTVLRTGYALMWDSMVSRSQYGQHQFETWGWPQVSGFDTGTINTTSGAVRTVESFSSLAIGLPRPQPWNATGAFFNDPDRKNAYSHQWHVEAQREITRDLMVGLAYVGSYNGRMEFAGRAFLPRTAAVDPVTGRRLTAAERDALRPWPHITTDARYSNDIGMAKYNALQVKVQRRFADGLASMLSYTWSHGVDTSSGWFGVENGIGGGGAVQNYWDIDDARSVSSLRHPAHPDVGDGLGAAVREGQALAPGRRAFLDPRQLAAQLDAHRPLGTAHDGHGGRGSREHRLHRLRPGRPGGRPRPVRPHVRQVVQHGGVRGSRQPLRNRGAQQPAGAQLLDLRPRPPEERPHRPRHGGAAQDGGLQRLQPHQRGQPPDRGGQRQLRSHHDDERPPPPGPVRGAVHLLTTRPGALVETLPAAYVRSMRRRGRVPGVSMLSRRQILRLALGTPIAVPLARSALAAARTDPVHPRGVARPDRARGRRGGGVGGQARS